MKQSNFDFIMMGKSKLSLKINEVQTSTKGRPFRVSGSKTNLSIPKKWFKEQKIFMHHFIHSFIYLDQDGGMFEIECDYENKYIPNSLKKC